MKDPHSLHPPLTSVVIDRSVRDTDITKNILSNLSRFDLYKNTDVIVTDDYHQWIRDAVSENGTANSKETLLIYPEKGNFIHNCPGSDGVLCCRYYVIDFGMNCPYDCYYCFLQSYTKNRFLSIAGNAKERLQELETLINSDRSVHWRIGTGEYMDSLALDHLTGLGSMLVEFFSGFDNATLELKTKSVEIESLPALVSGQPRNTVISWSLNPQTLIDQIEPGTAPLASRLSAAALAVAKGYQIAFHFDPIVDYPEWESGYSSVLEDLFNTLPQNSIRWISLGTFRYTPGLKEELRLSHPEEKITRAEMLLHPDNKFRYITPKREKIYRFMKDKLEAFDKEQLVYLCMETRGMWRKVYNYAPTGPVELDKKFEERRIFVSGHMLKRV